MQDQSPQPTVCLDLLQVKVSLHNPSRASLTEARNRKETEISQFPNPLCALDLLQATILYYYVILY